MTLSKFTNQPANEEIVNTINDIIESMGSTTGANIDLSNLSSTGNSKFQTPLVSGTNIKTINNQSILGSGNIDTTEVFVAEYDVTSYADVLAAYNAGKTIYVKYTGDGVISEPIGYYSFVEYNNIIPPESFIFSRTHGTLIENVIVSYSLINQGSTIWNMTSTTAANTTLSNVSSIDSNSAVQTALDGKADTSLSNLSATGKTVIDGQWVYSYANIVSSDITMTSTYSHDFSVSTYLPNDSNKYEVIVGGMATTGATSGTTVDIRIGSDIITSSTFFLRTQTRASASVQTANSITIPVGTGRNIHIDSYSSGTLIALRIYGYRRIGSNT